MPITGVVTHSIDYPSTAKNGELVAELYDAMVNCQGIVEEPVPVKSRRWSTRNDEASTIKDKGVVEPAARR